MKWGWKKKKHYPLYILIQGSSQPQALTDILFQTTLGILADHPVAVVTIDVRNRNIDFSHPLDGRFVSLEMRAILEACQMACGYVIVSPVYSRTIPGVIKNVITSIESALRGKVAGMICVGKKDDLYAVSRNLVDLLSDRLDMTVIKPIICASPESFRNHRIFDEQLESILYEMISALLEKTMTHQG